MEEAARSGVVTDGGAPHWQYRFSHALVREVLYKDLPANRRIELHAGIGAAIEKLHHDDLKPYQAALAHHFSAADATEKAIEYSLGAGTASSEVFAYQEARAHWERTLNPMTGDYGAAIRYAQATLALYQSLGDEEQIAECHTSLGICYAIPNADISDIGRARDHFGKAKQLLSKRPEGLALAHVYTGNAQTAFVSRRTEEGLAAAKQAMEIEERFHDDARWAGTAIQYGLHLVESGRLAESRELQEQSWQKLDHTSLAQLAFISTWCAATSHAFPLDIPEAIRWYQRELSKPRRYICGSITSKPPRANLRDAARL
jgi:tetratricopeptide (TPR) repeat protein